MSSVSRKLAVTLLVAFFATGCTEQRDSTPTAGFSNTPSPEIGSSPATTPIDHADHADHAVLRIRRQLPEGPIFVEGSAAHVQITDSSGAVVLERYFDVPKIPGASRQFPRQVRVELPPDRYRVQIVQRPCDASACSAAGPQEWGEATLRCEVAMRLSNQQIFTLTAVVRPGECRIAQKSVLGQVGT